MKNFKSLCVLMLFTSITILHTGCINEGCIDPDAVNYDPNANKDCGCCTYQGNVIFWHSIASADALLAGGVSHLSYYANGVLLGTIVSNVCWECYNDPYCGTDGFITADVMINNNDSETVTFECYDQNDNKLWTYDVDVYANKCIQIVISYGNNGKSELECKMIQK